MVNSLKHTIVAILLLGVSYGVYQAITLPSNQAISGEGGEIDGLVIDTGELSGSELSSLSALQDSAVNSTPATPSTDVPSSTNSVPPLSRSFAGSDSLVETTPTSPLANEMPASDNRFVGSSQPNSGSSSQRSFERPGMGQTNAAPIDSTGPGNRGVGFAGGPAAAAEGQLALVGGAHLAEPAMPFSQAFDQARSRVEQQDFRGALQLLTPFVASSDLSESERAALLEWADALALKVVYSTEHHLFKPYITAANESLESLATAWNVSPQLIYDINRSAITDYAALPPGVALKKVAGPFEAVVDLQDRELTLYVDGLYAGRFTLLDPVPTGLMPGGVSVNKKDMGGHPAGTYWIGTDRPDVFFHAPGFGPSSGLVVSPEDARDLFGILSAGSRISIQ